MINNKFFNIIPKQRIKSALYIFSFFIISIIWLKYIYYILIIVLCILSYFEWKNMIMQNNFGINLMLNLVNKFNNKNIIENLFSNNSNKVKNIQQENEISKDKKMFFILIMPAFLCLIFLRSKYEYIYTLIFFFHIWMVDIFAMLSGKIIGGYKLAPKISPNKTISGFICGIVTSSFVIAYFIINILKLNNLNFNIFNFDLNQNYILFILFCYFGILNQLGDLICSSYKRKYNIKDFSNIIPGHGGILDRFDSIILSAPIYLYIIYNLNI
ncbi:MAG: phosphatidate cytidylyltransferase [Rickettsiales bacterium]